MKRKRLTTSTTAATWVVLLIAGMTGAAHAAPAAHTRAAIRPQRAAARATTAPKPAAAAAGMPRTLSDVHIEGEIPVPQVLFITARDQRRFMDFQHHRYLESSAQLGEHTPFPTWVAVVHGSPADSRKETSR